MRTRGYARKTDRGCKSVHRPWYPAVVVIPAGNYCGYGKNPGSVPGWEGTALKRRLAATEEGIVERSSMMNITRSFPACNRFDCKIDNSAVRVSLSREQRRTGLI